jgi:hypothetical protein
MQPFFIGQMSSGQQSGLEPFYIAKDAFTELENVFVWRGRLRKRFGSALIGSTFSHSRLRLNIGTTDANGDFTSVAPGVIFKLGQTFSIGEEIFTAVNDGTSSQQMITTGASTSSTFEFLTGEVAIVGSTPTSEVYFYPSEPCMGIHSREKENPVPENLVVFDTQFSYRQVDVGSGFGWDFIDLTTWSGFNDNFFWTATGKGSIPAEAFLYATNNVDLIHFLPRSSNTWEELFPILNTSGSDRYLWSCLILISFKGRLLALNTLESDGVDKINFKNRARFSQNGDPTKNDASWLEKIGSGGFIDAPIKEGIVSAEKIKDRLIVYFESSTWELIYTGSFELPFRWKQINSSLGASSPFSVIGFDKAVLGIGYTGIHSCDGVSVERIDKDIPEEAFKINQLEDQRLRVGSVRDFVTEMVYWTYSESSNEALFPNRILAYNYTEGVWSLFRDTITCFGRQKSFSGGTWDELPAISWEDSLGTWGSGSVSDEILMGNQHGVVSVLKNTKSSSSQTLYITEMKEGQTLEIEDHSLKTGDHILIEGCVGITDLNDKIFQIERILSLRSIIIDTAFSGTYLGGGKVTRVNNFLVGTREFNFSMDSGQRFTVPYVDFLLEKTSAGEFSVEYFCDSGEGSSQIPTSIRQGSSTVLTRPEEVVSAPQGSQTQIWHRFFLHVECGFLKLVLSLTDDQMRSREISSANFLLHGIIFYVQREGRAL